MKKIIIPADYFADIYMLVRNRSIFFYKWGKFLLNILPPEKSKLTDLLKELYDMGWGKFKLVWYSENRIIIKGISVFAEQLRKYYGVQKHPVDDFIVGVLDTWADKKRLKLRFREIECVGMGNERCVFVGEFIKRPKHCLVELQQNLKGEII